MNGDRAKYAEFDAAEWFNAAPPYVRHGGSRCTCRCFVDSVAALEWLAYRRPDVLSAIRNLQHAA